MKGPSTGLIQTQAGKDQGGKPTSAAKKQVYVAKLEISPPPPMKEMRQKVAANRPVRAQARVETVQADDDEIQN